MVFADLEGPLLDEFAVSGPLGSVIWPFVRQINHINAVPATWRGTYARTQACLLRGDLHPPASRIVRDVLTDGPDISHSHSARIARWPLVNGLLPHTNRPFLPLHEKSPIPSIIVRRFSRRSPRRYCRFHLVLDRMAQRASSATSLGWLVVSAAQSRKAVRKPCAVADSFNAPSSSLRKTPFRKRLCRPTDPGDQRASLR